MQNMKKAQKMNEANFKLIQEKMSELANSENYKDFIAQYELMSPRFQAISENVKLLTYYLLCSGNFLDVVTLLPDMIFEKVPVGIKEFFESDNYGGAFNKTLRSSWRKEIYDFFKDGSSFEEVIFTGAAGTGKTTIARYMVLYTLYKICCLKNPQAVFGLSQESPLSIVFLSSTLDMARKISLLPFVEVLSLCPAFERVKSVNAMYSYSGNKIPYVYTDSENILRFKNNISIEIGSGKTHLIGKNVIASFLDEAELGGKVDDVLELYAELGMRIRSRFKSSSFTFMSMISSAGMSNGVISQYLERMNEFIGKSVKLCNYAKWELDLNVDPYENGYFYVFGGTTVHPSSIITEEEAKQFLSGEKQIPAFCDIIKVPKEHYPQARKDIEKMLRDVCGRNTQVSEILFPDLDRLEHPGLCPMISLDSSVNSNLRLSTQLPADLFITGHDGKRYFSRYPKAPRYIAVDLSLNRGSETAVCVLHKEDAGDEEVYVVDALINITTHDKIRLDSIPELIMDLKYDFNLIIEEISLDQWQTEPMIQYFMENRVAKRVVKRSTSRTLQPVRTLSNLVAQNRVKVGKAKKLRKQLSSLALDPGQERLTYKNSKKQGIYDLSEVLINSVYSAFQDKTVVPVNNYIDGNFMNSKEKLKDKTFVNGLLDKFNLKI